MRRNEWAPGGLVRRCGRLPELADTLKLQLQSAWTLSLIRPVDGTPAASRREQAPEDPVGVRLVKKNGVPVGAGMHVWLRTFASAKTPSAGRR